jgi:hypothetical protein
MSLADEILGLFEESEKLEAEFATLEERAGGAFTKLEQDLLKVQFMDSIEADLFEDSVESLMRAQEKISGLVQARIQQKLDVE